MVRFRYFLWFPVPRSLLVCLSLVTALLPCAFGQDQATSVQKVGPDVHPPIAVNAPAAEFPDASRRTHTSGDCAITLVVGVDGLPHNPKIIRCTDPMFEQTSPDAVMRYRFKPATTVHGDKPVPVEITVVINYRLGFGHKEPSGRIDYALSSPPGMLTSEADAKGVYPLSKGMQLPKMTRFVSRRFFQAAFATPTGSTCRVLMVLDANGKPESAKAEACDATILSRRAEESLMKSKFTPAMLNGRPVPVRFVLKLVYEDLGR